MKKCLGALLLLCSGCTSNWLQIKDPVTDDVSVTQDSHTAVAQLPNDVLRPRRSIDELLVQRLAICNEAEGQREAFLATINVASNTADNSHPGVDEALLNQLLMASCSPAKKPGVLNQLLADLTSAGTWPEEYAAFFDLMISGQRAYAAVEKVYLDLKQEHEKTIQGLSEIESQIDKHSTAASP